ncbi:MAG: hypothetical protein HRU70_05470 [Phycisphaeraceae bacterium]|nr:MAG: hypothetical protein HRU70_05470 [Phycisphaeraceae bacterium]
MNTRFAIALAVLPAAGALAQSTISPDHKLAWGENIGWLNWRDAGNPAGSQGVFIAGPIMGGFIWAENVGYINLGDGSPANGVAYQNTSGQDAGVNILPDSRLAGLAWGENIGWINFGPFASLPAAQQARVDYAGGRLRGYAWGENVGWINLDDATRFVGVACPADWNCDGFVDFFDFDDFVTTFEGGTPPACRTDADFNGDGFVDFFDFDDFVLAFEAGC